MRYPLAVYQPRQRDFDLVTKASWLDGRRASDLDLDWFAGLRIFDAAGFEREVTGARIVRERKRLLGLRRECDLALDFGGTERPVPLAELAALVSEAGESDSSLWEYRDDVSSAAEFKSLVDAARSHEELIRLLDGGLSTAP